MAAGSRAPTTARCGCLPRCAVDWAPYSHGHWGWVQPWGWTWVDDAPWGFAPFHYGRWVYVRDRWCWTPGACVARPVYAPALVAWVGGDRAATWRSAIGGGAGGLVPARAARGLCAGLPGQPALCGAHQHHGGHQHDGDHNVFNNPQGPREFENRRLQRGITVVPAEVMVERRPVAPAAAQWRQSPGCARLRQWTGPRSGAARAAGAGAAPRAATRSARRAAAARPADPARGQRPPIGAGRERSEDVASATAETCQVDPGRCRPRRAGRLRRPNGRWRRRGAER